MRFLRPRLLALGSAAAVCAAAVAVSIWSPASVAASPDPQRDVIVMFNGDTPLAAGHGVDKARVARARQNLRSQHHDFAANARSRGLRLTGERSLDLLVNALATSVPASEVVRLRALPGVAAVVPDAPVQASTDVSVPLIGAPDVWDGKDPSGTPAKGEGVTVAVLDTGIDYTHPDLGAGFGEGHKVVGGYDFVNDDADPMDDNGHGTHVAGIIAAKAAEPGGVTGVAPEASLLAYKVMDASGQGETSTIIEGLEASVDPANPHRADIVNMSLGGYGDGLDPLGLAATAATRAGVVVVAAAGNSGPNKSTISTPAAADGVIAVGASISNLRLPVASVNGVKLQTYRGQLSANPPTTPVTAPLVDIGYGSTADMDAAGDLHGKVVRVNAFVAPSMNYLSRGEVDRAKELERRGAIAVIGGQSGPGGGGPVVAADGTVPLTSTQGLRIAESGDLYRMDNLIVMGMDSTQYDELTAELAAGPVKVTITGVDVTDQMASFSSRGPSPRFSLKPDLVAPGYEIRSTVPTALFAPGQYRLSGTSMAAPHVAGAAALLRQLHPGEAPADITSALVGTTAKVDGAPTTRGSGRLDVAAAANAVVTADPPSISFGLADLGAPRVGATATVTLRNSSTKPVTAELGAGAAQISIKPSTVTIPPSGATTVTVILKAKTPTVDTDLTGDITVAANSGPSIRIPYLMVVRPLVVQTTPDPSDGHTAVWVGAPTGLAAAPVLTVARPRGGPEQVTTTRQWDNVYKADLSEDAAGAYAVTVNATTSDGLRLTGSGGFEVTAAADRKVSWQSVGPNSSGGRLALSQSDPNLAVMTTDYTAGPWLTTDHGASWTQINRLPVATATGLGTVVIDATNASRWWYALNDLQTGGRVLRTDDKGETWRTLDLPNGYVKTLVADQQTRTLAAVVDDTVWMSTDGGDTWQQRPVGISSINDVAFGDDDLYIANSSEVWKLPAAATGAPAAPVKVFPAPDTTLPSYYYLQNLAADSDVVAVYAWNMGLVTSHDGGTTWSNVDPNKFDLYGLWASGGDLFTGGFDGTMKVGHDHGRTWETIPAPSTAALPYDVGVWADGTTTIAMDNGLFARTGDGYRRLGVPGLTVDDLAVSGNTLLTGTDSGLYRTAMPITGSEWGAASGEGYIGETASLLAVSPVDGNTVWKVRKPALDEFRIARSDDGGQTFTEVGSGSEIPTAILVHPADPDRVYVGFDSLNGPGLVVTTDGGVTWKNLYLDERVNAIAGDPTNPSRIWLGTQSGLYRSDDGGVTVTKVTDGLVSAIHIDGGRMILGGLAVRLSTDGGKTFRTGDTGPLGVYVTDLAQAGKVLYAATGNYYQNGLAKGGRGVLCSTDGGLHWHTVSWGLANRDVTSLVVSPDGTALYAGTRNGGVYRMPLG